MMPFEHGYRAPGGRDVAHDTALPYPGDLMSSGFSTMRAAFGSNYFIVSALARLPLSMLVLGVLTFVSHSTGQLSSAGAASAIAGVGVAVGAPLSGAAADRWGQRATLLVGGLAYCASLLWLLAAGSPGDEPLTFGPRLAAAAFCSGLVVPQCGPMTRVRWIRRLAGRDAHALTAAQGYESTIDELSFVLGPAAVGIIAVAAGPAAPLWVALALTVVTIPWFALHRSSASGAAHRGTATAATVDRVPWALVGVLLLGMLSIGTVFGSLATTTTAFVTEAGQPDIGGLVYAAIGITSGLGALSVARWPSRWSSAIRWIGCGAALVPALGLLWLAATPWQLSLLFLLVGAPIGPVLVTVFTAAGGATPAGRLGLVMTLLSAGVTLGTSIGNWAGGSLAETGGHAASLWVTFAAGCAVLVSGVLYATREALGRPRNLQRATEGAKLEQ